MHCESEKCPLQAEYIGKHNVYSLLCPISKETMSTSYNKQVCGYVHYFQDNNCEISCSEVLYSHRVKISTSCPTKLVTYTLTSPTTLHVASDVHNKLIAKKFKSSWEFTANYKQLVLVTNKECKLHVTIVPVAYVDNYNSLEYTLTNRKDGHLTVKLPTSSCATKSIPRMLSPGNAPDVTTYCGLKYCLSMNSILTVTEDVPKELRYPPYSVKLPQVAGVVSTLKYRIVVKASEGDNAHVTVTCIESLSRNRYAILKDIKGDNIHNTHVGQVLEGSLKLTLCPIDVGLHIYTPYGFSGDLGDNPDKDLATIEEFTLLCQ